MTTILHIASSTRGDESATQLLANELIDRVAPDARVVERPLADGVPQLTIAATGELAAPATDRSAAAAQVLATGDQLIAELADADIVVIGAPVYNFGPPASLKAWADLVARAGTTFSYTETGPVGLLEDRPVYIVSASGGTPIGSELDHATTWLTQFLNFLGITDITVVGAEGFAIDPDAALANARRAIAAIAA